MSYAKQSAACRVYVCAFSKHGLTLPNSFHLQVSVA